MLAWLSARPEKDSPRNGEVYSGAMPPEVDHEVAHLPTWLDELGVVAQGGFGPSPLSWVEIESWSRQAGIELTEFEARALRLMSASYASIANDPKADCPVDDASVRSQRHDAAVASWASFGS